MFLTELGVLFTMSGLQPSALPLSRQCWIARLDYPIRDVLEEALQSLGQLKETRSTSEIWCTIWCTPRSEMVAIGST